MSRANFVQFIGNLLTAPQTGPTVAYARIAVDLLDHNRHQTGTLFIGLAAYGDAAAALAPLRKGQRIAVEGRMDPPGIHVDAAGHRQPALRMAAFALSAIDPLPKTTPSSTSGRRAPTMLH